MKENKDVQLKFRLTTSQKTQIENYCATHNITVSEFLRMTVNEFLGGKQNGKQ